MKHWNLIWDPPLPGKENMEKDLELLEKVASGEISPTLRFYSWLPPAISLGYNQDAEKVVHLQACREMGIDVVHRPTGGRAVLHLNAMTYSIVVSENYPGLPKGVLGAYRMISQGFIEGLNYLGIKADLVPAKKTNTRIAPGACFDTLSSYEIQVKGKKVMGSAQLRRNGVLLQHGVIIMELPLFYYQNLLKGKKQERLIETLASRASGLYELGYNNTEEEIAEALKSGLGQVFNAVFETKTNMHI